MFTDNIFLEWQWNHSASSQERNFEISYKNSLSPAIGVDSQRNTKRVHFDLIVNLQKPEHSESNALHKHNKQTYEKTSNSLLNLNLILPFHISLV